MDAIESFADFRYKILRPFTLVIAIILLIKKLYGFYITNPNEPIETFFTLGIITIVLLLNTIVYLHRYVITVVKNKISQKTLKINRVIGILLKLLSFGLLVYFFALYKDKNPQLVLLIAAVFFSQLIFGRFKK